MLSHRDIIRALRTTLKALPEHPHACDVVAAPGTGTRTIVVRDSRGRPLLTVSALAAVYAPAVPGRERRTLDELAPRPELPEVPPLAVDPTAPGVRVMRVGDAVFAPDRATWAVGDIERTEDHDVEGETVSFGCDAHGVGDLTDLADTRAALRAHLRCDECEALATRAHAETASFCCDAHGIGDGWADTTHAAAVRAAMEGER